MHKQQKKRRLTVNLSNIVGMRSGGRTGKYPMVINICPVVNVTTAKGFDVRIGK